MAVGGRAYAALRHAAKPSVNAMETAQLIEQLRKKRARLLKAYIFHVCWFFSTCASAATEATQFSLPTLLVLTLVTVPPVLFYTVVVHRACRSIDPTSRTMGVVPVVLFTIFLTPLESGLVLPLKNLWVSKCIIRAWEIALTSQGCKAPSARDAGTGAPT